MNDSTRNVKVKYPVSNKYKIMHLDTNRDSTKINTLI